jgi:beta-galactosidase
VAQQSPGKFRLRLSIHLEKRNLPSTTIALFSGAGYSAILFSSLCEAAKSTKPPHSKRGLIMQTLRGISLSVIVVLVHFATGSPGRAQANKPAVRQHSAHISGRDLRVRESLDADWKFKRQADPGAATEAEFVGAEQTAYNDSHWTAITLPHTWDATWENPFPTSSHFRGVGWYRRQFRVRPEWQNKRVSVAFKGVFQIADVWVNGKFAGHHVGGFTGFQLDVTDLLHWNAPNLLAVRVDDVMNPAIAPANETNVTVYGGIYRTVSLLVTEPLHVRANGTWVTMEGTAVAPLVRVRTWIENSAMSSASAKLETAIVDDEGHTVATLNGGATVAPGETREFDQTSTVIANPLLWSPNAPHLYQAVSTLADGARPADRYVTTFGIRFLRVDPASGFVLNGRPINLHGVDRRQDYGFLGDAVPEAVGRRDIQWIKNMGANFLRTAHYPQDPAVLDECDRLGILTWEEIPNIKIHIYPGVEDSANPVFTERFPRPLMANLKQQMREMIERDRNHPAIFIWGVSDDLSSYHYPEDFVELSDAVHALDPTRWSAGRAPHVTDIIDATSSQDLLEEHRQHPDRGFIWNEWGAFQSERGMEGKPYRHRGSDDDYSLPDSLAAQMLEGLLMQWNALPWLGTGKWCMFDTGEMNATATSTLWETPAREGKVQFRWPFDDYLGVSDMWRLPKNGFYFLQSQWTEKPMVHIVGHWTWPGQEGHKRQVRVYSNCETVELELNGRSLGVHPPETTEQVWQQFQQASEEIQYHPEFHPGMLPEADLKHPPFVWEDVPYEAGTLVAIGHKGNAVVRDELRTAGQPLRIALKAEKSALNVADEDVSFIAADVVDSNGTVVPDARPWIQFAVRGPGRLLGGTTEIDAITGVAAINVQTTGKPGEITVTATAPKLEPGSVSIGAPAK